MIEKLTKTLTDAGFSNREAQVYLVCLQFGPLSITDLARRIGIKRTTLYEATERLRAKQALTFIYQGKRRQLAAASPDQLRQILEGQAKVQLEVAGKFASLISEFASLAHGRAAKPAVRFYEGRQGVRALMEELLDSKEKEHLHIITNAVVAEALGKDFLRRWIKRRIAAGIKVRGIRIAGGEVGEPIYDGPGKQYLREIRTAPPIVRFPMGITITDDKVAIISSQRENYGLLVASHDFSQVMRSLFNVLWGVSKK